MRGFGRSGPADGEFGSAVEDLRLLLDHLQVDQAVICGSSMGGVVALHFALEHQSLAAGLILVSTDLSGFPISSEFAESLLATYEVLKNDDTNRAADIWLNHPMLLPVRRHRRAHEHLKMIVEDYSWGNWLKGRVYLVNPPALTRLNTVTAPTLIITGLHDLARFKTIADKLHREIPGSQRVTIPGTSHLPNMESPELFNNIVVDAIAK